MFGSYVGLSQRLEPGCPGQPAGPEAGRGGSSVAGRPPSGSLWVRTASAGPEPDVALEPQKDLLFLVSNTKFILNQKQVRPVSGQLSSHTWLVPVTQAKDGEPHSVFNN